MTTIDPRKTACFTGHRPNKLGGYDETTPLWRQIRQDLRISVLCLISDGFDTFISGMALGVDTVAAEVVLELRQQMPEMGIRLVAAVPFFSQDRIWKGESVARYQSILSQVDYMHIVCQGGYAPYKMAIRNHWMVDNSSLVLAVWNGITEKGSGTSECVQYAQHMGRELYVISPTPRMQD